ncbi:MAG: flagellar biosynthetic protein FliR [Lachnospira sp.]|nr:flagellar biosynthetic protein FliR [Lachnospira sp.]
MISYDVALAQFEIFILILMRMASFIFVAPFFNTANTPRRSKVALAFFLTVLIYSLNTDVVIEYDGIFEYVAIVLKEVVVGLILGVMTSFCVQIIMFAGKIIDLDVGLAMAQIFDPTTHMQVGILGNFYYYILLLLLMVSGMHHYLIEAIFETYKVIPIGKLTLSPSIYETVVGFMSDYFIIGFRIALPVFAATLILNVILAILARVAPQMNMFVVGMQLKIFVGLFAILLTIVLMPMVSTLIENEIKSIMAKLVRGMSP